MQNSPQFTLISQTPEPGNDSSDWWDDRLGGSRSLRRLRDISPTLSTRRLNADCTVLGSRPKD